MNTQLNTFFCARSDACAVTVDVVIDTLKTLHVGIPGSEWFVDPVPTLREKYITLWRVGSETRFTPITAVYYELTGIETHYGSFIYPEIVRDLRLPELEIVEIVYASMGLDCPRHYNRILRNQILEALGLPIEEKRLL